MKTQLKIRTEYSFKLAYGHIEQVTDRLQQLGCKSAAITDRSSTFGHISWAKHCKIKGIKPIFGVELGFVHDIEERNKRENQFWLPLLARSNAGLQEIYSAVEEATFNFYYTPRLPISKLDSFSKDVIILSGNSGLGQHPLPKKVFIEGHSATNKRLSGAVVPVSDNYMVRPEDRHVYEIMMGRTAFRRPSPMHILSYWEAVYESSDSLFALADTLATECNVTIEPATNIKTIQHQSLLELCVLGATQRNLLLAGDYQSRLQHELKLIEDKGFVDYFLVIADVVQYAKTHMLVGPARGSSCGSLVCYLLGITDIDPLQHDLIFERFIDVTRHDLPDIDLDFQDDKREMVFDYLVAKYGNEKVARLGTVIRHKAKSAINATAKALRIPKAESDQIAEIIVKRNDGDERADQCIYDTFTDTDVGKAFIQKYPNMLLAARLESHASHEGRHAAGVVITNDPIRNYVAVDVKRNIMQIDKYDAEKINLMKVDILGLRTLTIIADCLERIGWDRTRLLHHPLDDDVAFKVLRQRLFCGVFQFEGYALQGLTRNVPVNQFSDISALTALARPGPLISGAAHEWCARRTGNRQVELLHEMMRSITEDTFGLIVYQEQMLRIIREIGGMSWEDTTALRKGMSKSLGLEYFERYWERFAVGARQHGIEVELARRIWETVNSAGGYAFNRAHSVAYAMISYWTCVLKGHFPLDYAVSTLKYINDPLHIKQYLRELDRMGFKFKTYDRDLSGYNWEVKEGTVVGGLTNIKGIGPKLANQIIDKREQGLPLSASQEKKLTEGNTPYDDVFEARKKFPDLLAHPTKYGIVSKIWNIVDIPSSEGNYAFLAKVIKWKVRSLNELQFLIKRNNMKVPNDRWLTVLLEDDSDTIYGTISRHDFARLGEPLTKAHSGNWYVFRGSVREGTRRIFIEKYKKLNEEKGNANQEGTTVPQTDP